mmetsp:Transcript_16080/g.32432  ORF Transcript_16080/g.32432 Transcript_16080/m.32432 type:complete len:102 (+) Transcript_16080:622-927(+)
MMKFELGLECPDPKRPLRSAAAIGLSYAVGGLIPLLPYMVLPLAHDAMFYSVWTTALALFAFGAYKGSFVGQRWFFGGLEVVCTGLFAAFSAYFVTKFLGA